MRVVEFDGLKVIRLFLNKMWYVTGSQCHTYLTVLHWSHMTCPHCLIKYVSILKLSLILTIIVPIFTSHDRT